MYISMRNAGSIKKIEWEAILFQLKWENYVNSPIKWQRLQQKIGTAIIETDCYTNISVIYEYVITVK